MGGFNGETMANEISVSSGFDSLSLRPAELAKLTAKLGLHAVSLILSGGASAPAFAAAIPELGADLVGCVGRAEAGKAEALARKAVTASAGVEASRQPVTPERIRQMWEQLRSLGEAVDSSQRVRLIAAAALGQPAEGAPSAHDLYVADWFRRTPLQELAIWEEFMAGVFGDSVVDEDFVTKAIDEMKKTFKPVAWPGLEVPREVEAHLENKYPWYTSAAGRGISRESGLFTSVTQALATDADGKLWMVPPHFDEAKAGLKRRWNGFDYATPIGARIANCFSLEKQIMKLELEDYARVAKSEG